MAKRPNRPKPPKTSKGTTAKLIKLFFGKGSGK